MKNKKIVITLIITIAILIILSVGAVAALYFTTDIFKTNEQIFWKYFSENSKIVSILNNENVKLQNELKSQNSYTTEGDLTISTQIGVSDPTQINIATTSRHDINTGRTYADATLKKEDKDLLKVSYINSNNVYSVRCEDINQYYIGFRNENLKQLFTTLGMDEEQAAIIPDSIDFEALSSNSKIDNSILQHISETYSNIILQNIPKESYQKLGKETITVNGTSYEANKYALTLTADTLEKIIVECLTQLKNDETTLTYITENLLNELLTMSLGHKPTNEEIISAIDNIIEDVNTGSTDDAITITVYEQGGKTVRTILDFVDLEKITVDLLQNQFTLLISQYSNSEYDDLFNTNMQVTFMKTSGETITNSIEIMPDIDNPDNIITILASIGNTQNGTANNSYSISINSITNDANTMQEINYNTQITSVDQVEEIMELKDDNSVIVNNYPLDQLTTFFNGILVKAGQVFNNVAQQLESEINAFVMPIYSVGI